MAPHELLRDENWESRQDIEQAIDRAQVRRFGKAEEELRAYNEISEERKPLAALRRLRDRESFLGSAVVQHVANAVEQQGQMLEMRLVAKMDEIIERVAAAVAKLIVEEFAE